MFSNRKTIINILIFIIVIAIFNVIDIKHAKSASLFFSSKCSEYYMNKEFVVDVYLSSNDKKVNALSGRVLFPKDMLIANNISIKNSIIDLFIIEPEIDNKNGSISFEGIILDGGFSGENTKIISITFKPRKEGSFSLNFLDTLVLENDGNGTEIETKTNDKSFYILNKNKIAKNKSFK